MSTPRLLFAFYLLVGLCNPASALLITPADMPKTPVAAPNAWLSRHVEGLQALEKNDLIAAEGAFRETMRLNAQAPEPLLGLADLALRKNQPAEAWNWLDKAARLAPQNALVHQAIGRYHFATRQASKAIDALKRAQKLDPNNALIAIDMGEIYMQGMQQPELAATAYRRALDLNPEHAGAHYGLGVALANSGKLADAESELNRASALAPTNPLPKLALGKLYLSQKQSDKALASLDAALKIQPDLVAARLDKGAIHTDKGELQHALTEFQHAAKVAPKSDVAQLKLGMAYQSLGRANEAEQAYLAAIRVNPKLALAYNNLAWMNVEKNRNLAQAEQWSKKATELAPKVSGFFDTLGWVFRAQGKLSMAEAALLKANSLEPVSAEIYYHLGVVYQDQQKTKQAAAAFRKALSIQKDYLPAQQALAKTGK